MLDAFVIPKHSRRFVLLFSSLASASSSVAKKSCKKGTVKLHPSNAMVMRTLVPLANCCNFEEDYAASVRSVAPPERT